MNTDYEPTPWDVYDLPPVGEMQNVTHDNDVAPTPEGQLRAYFDDTLMRSLHSCRFSVGFDAPISEIQGFVFQAPASMWADEETPDATLETLMTDHEIPIAERESDDPHERVFGPTDAVSWDFEIRLETTPYGGETA